ncbi:MAG TPA: TrbI/VirB10 family protein, partial [Candidatus Methylacidiphilales bacterium]
TAFALVLLVLGILIWGFTHDSSTPVADTNPKKPDLEAPEAKAPKSSFFGIPDAGFANKNHATTPESETGSTSNWISRAPQPLPLTLYHTSDVEPGVSDTYAPYGRLIPCETVITIDSAKIETPIIGYVTEDLWHDGKLIIPAGAEVHGKAQVDSSRERIASEDQWYVVWRTTDRLDGAELPLHGVALDMERNYPSGTWQLTDGSAGLKGDILKTDNWAEIKLFAATFLSAAASGLQQTQDVSSPLTGATQQVPLSTPQNAALQGTSAVLNQYAQQIADSIKRDGFYVRVPAGKQFYLYVTQTIDLERARRGSSQLDFKSDTHQP